MRSIASSPATACGFSIRQALRAALAPGFAGHVSLIHGAGEEWEDLDRLAEICGEVLANIR